MKTKSLPLLAVVTALACPFIHANATAPAYWICKADCFYLGGNDGSSLEYNGQIKSEPHLDKQTAFDELSDQCGEGELYKRTLVRTYTETTQETINNGGSEFYWWRGYRYWNHTYEINHHELRGVFTLTPASKENACEQKSIERITIESTGNGDPIMN